MMNEKRRIVLKGMSLLVTLPALSLTALGVNAATHENQDMALGFNSSEVIKREFTLTNLTPNALTLDKTNPISIPAYVDSSQVKFDVSKASGATIEPGENITFDVFVAKDSMLDVSIDEVLVNTNQSNIEHIVSAMNFTAQVSII